MDVLDVVDRFCMTNDITYSMGCGTLLGAIRHKGYIPWDDDIDIYMLRKDYEKFILSFPEEFHNIKIASLERDKKWTRAYAQAYDNRTVMQDAGNKYQVGVGIDIFPIDYVPEEEFEWKKYNRRRRFLQKLYVMKSLSFCSKRSFVKNVLIFIFKIILFAIPLRTIGYWIDRYAKKWINSNSAFVFENSQGSGLRNRFDANLFKEVIPLPFEDRYFMGFKDSDNYLRNSYGDYMQLPPKEKQITHHSFCAWWKE